MSIDDFVVGACAGAILGVGTGSFLAWALIPTPAPEPPAFDHALVCEDFTVIRWAEGGRVTITADLE